MAAEDDGIQLFLIEEDQRFTLFSRQNGKPADAVDGGAAVVPLLDEGERGKW